MKTRPAVVISGARQTGKSSLLRRMFPGYKYVSLDLPSEAEAAEHDSSSFIDRLGEPLIIDEIQYAPKLFRHLKILIDRERNRNGRFIMTGSQKFVLMKEVSDSLAGRVVLLELETLSVREIYAVTSEMPVERIILRGGFPELYSNPEINSRQFYQSYISTYLERDVRQILNVGNLRDFERFLRALALRSGQLLNKTELARDVGIHPTTASEWISVLEASNQVVLLEPWFSNRTKSLVKTPKVYLTDCGVLCFLLGITDIGDLYNSPHIGAIWETFVFAELRKEMSFGDKGISINFWRGQSAEIDFLVDRGGSIQLFDAKWTETPDKTDTKGFLEFEKKLKSGKVISSSIICRAKNSYPLGGSISVRNLADSLL